MKISFHLVEPTAFFVMRTNEDTLEAGLAGVLHMQDGEWRYAEHETYVITYYPRMDLLSVLQQVHTTLGGEL